MKRYKLVCQVEPELPRYPSQLNLAATYVKMQQYVIHPTDHHIGLCDKLCGQGQRRLATQFSASIEASTSLEHWRSTLEPRIGSAPCTLRVTIFAAPPSATPSSSRGAMGSQLTAGSSKLNGADSSSSVPGDSQQKGSKHLPFARTFMDDYKVKIANLFLTLNVPVDMPPLEAPS